MNNVNFKIQKVKRAFFKELDVGTFFTNNLNDNPKLYLKINDKEAIDLEDRITTDNIKTDRFFSSYCFILDIEIDFQYNGIPLDINRKDTDSKVNMVLPMIYQPMSMISDSEFFVFANEGKRIPIEGLGLDRVYIFIRPFVIYDVVKNKIIELSQSTAEQLSIHILDAKINATFKIEDDKA